MRLFFNSKLNFGLRYCDLSKHGAAVQFGMVCHVLADPIRQIKTSIFGLLLISQVPISIDFYWLRPFVKGHARMPEANQTVEVGGSAYTIPVSWNTLVAATQDMRGDMEMFKSVLEAPNTKTRATRSPAKGLSTALLRVSHAVHKTAAQVFYSQNVFKFPCATSAWMQLESFIATIGPHNVAQVQHLRIHVPMWHRGIQEDFVDGAVMDLISPASRLAVVKPPVS